MTALVPRYDPAVATEMNSVQTMSQRAMRGRTITTNRRRQKNGPGRCRGSLQGVQPSGVVVQDQPCGVESLARRAEAFLGKLGEDSTQHVLEAPGADPQRFGQRA